VAVVFWLGVWQAVATVVSSAVLLVGPWQVLVRLVDLVPTMSFWTTVARTSGRIVAGFALAAVVGVLLAALSAASRWTAALVAPVVAAVRSTPVVAFIIVLLVWSDVTWLATTVAFVMTVPVIHTNVAAGIAARGTALAEMAAVFAVGRWRRLVAIDTPAVLPYFAAGCRTGVGHAWKAGVAAEVIGLPDGTIGERMYQGRLFLETADVLAWTVVVVLIAITCEKLLLAALTHRRDRAVDDSGDGSDRRVGQTHGRLERRAEGGRHRCSPVGSGDDGGDGSTQGSGHRPHCAAPTVLDGVSKAFGSHVVLRDVSASLAPGSVTAVLGPNGAGKTTLGRVVLGLEVPSAGTVSRPVRCRRSAVFADDRLVEHLSAVANVRLVLPRRAPDPSGALLAVGLARQALAAPVRTLSGGQRRRVALVRALLAPADVLVLDEPFTSLDTDAHTLALRWVREHLRAQATVLITHDTADVEALCATVLRLPTAADNGDGSYVLPGHRSADL